MSAKQVRLMLSQANRITVQGARDHAFLCLLFYEGSRIGSPGTIKVGDFYLDNGFYVLKWTRKGDVEQVLPVHPELQSALFHYLQLSGHGQDKEAPQFSAVKLGSNKGKRLCRVLLWQASSPIL